MKHSFRNDYGRFAHPRILNAIRTHGEELNDPYGLDRHSENAADLLRKEFGVPDASVHFFAGGTVTNMVFLSYLLKDYEAVICCDSGHIAVHETGAIEGSGHKVLTCPNVNGKITAEGIERLVKLHTDEHMVSPRVVYLSDSTESGTVYTKEELSRIRKCCDVYGLYLYLDGARLATALTSKDNDLKPRDIGRYCDAFYVGGGKNGLGIGEALLLVNPSLQKDFRYHVKNKGAMLAKGYLLGIEFEEGFKDGLFWELGRLANAKAEEVVALLKEKGYEPAPAPTNQVFCRFPRKTALKLIEEFGCETWSDEGEEIVLRFVTSYATSDDGIAALRRFL